MFVYFYSDDSGSNLEEINDTHGFGEHAGFSDSFGDTGAFCAFIYAGF